MRRRRREAGEGDLVSPKREAEEWRGGLVLVDRLPLARRSRPHPEEGDGRRAAEGRHEQHAVRRAAHDLRRLQGGGGPVKSLKIAAIVIILAIAGVLAVAAM